MHDSARSRLRRFAPAALLSLAIFAVAPFMGLLRDAVFRVLGPRATQAILASVVVVVGAAVLGAILSIRTHRLVRLGGLALVGIALWLQIAGLSTGLADVDAVEKIHVVEYGLLSVLLYRAALATRRDVAGLSLLALPFLGVVLVGTLDELIQWFFQLRVGEMRDVLLNVAAGASGIAGSLCVWPPRRVALWPRGPTRAEARRRLGEVLVATAVVLVVVGVFIDCAHLGHEIDDPEVGRFVSFHSPDELRAAARDRARRWAVDPPTGLDAWAREDRFLSEAAHHVQHRNQRLNAGDHVMAWQANRILERWFDPFLDIESFRGSGRHRWWPNDRRFVEVKALEGPAPPVPALYRSPVLEERVWLVPRGRVWLVVLLLAIPCTVGGMAALRGRTPTGTAGTGPGLPGTSQESSDRTEG